MSFGKNNTFKVFMTACPTHKAGKIVNGQTIHRLSAQLITHMAIKRFQNYKITVLIISY